MKRNMYRFAFVLGLIMNSFSLSAQDFPEVEQLGSEPVPQAAPTKGKTPPKKAPEAVLNFEGDMIEGEKRRPDLFLQTNVEDLSLDSILYLRKDFNDFHAVDHKRRPRHFRFKGKK